MEAVREVRRFLALAELATVLFGVELVDLFVDRNFSVIAAKRKCHLVEELLDVTIVECRTGEMCILALRHQIPRNALLFIKAIICVQFGAIA